MKKVAKKPTKKAVKKASKRTGNIVPQASLSFGSVVDSVSRLHTEFLRQATHAVNVSLTLRNWLIGAYIHEYELRGADRAKYGENSSNSAVADFIWGNTEARQAGRNTNGGLPNISVTGVNYRRLIQSPVFPVKNWQYIFSNGRKSITSRTDIGTVL